IAGAGPAGMATALYLLREHPELAGQVIALEKARHPRPKVCAGGLIPKTMLAMKELGLKLEVPAIEVRAGLARTEAGEIELGGGRIPDMIMLLSKYQFQEAFCADSEINRVAFLVEVMSMCNFKE